MAKPPPTRTYAQLHFEDIEPHRFEDLFRQLIYDHRNWRRLEATGRSGADDGYDVRGWEISTRSSLEDLSDEEETDVTASEIEERLWLIQCKREKEIGPAKLSNYLEEIPESDREKLYGVIFAASCDFSKRSRDLFREKMLEYGIAEGHLWGKGELEDMLFQPKNDHLLFAYFGISLQLRRKSVKAQVRASLAAKRKVQRLLSKQERVTIIDGDDDRFPHLEDDGKLEGFFQGRWRTYQYVGCRDEGAVFRVANLRAYVSADRTEWDFDETGNMVRYHDDPWDRDCSSQEVIEKWNGLPSDEKARLTVDRVVPYERIIDIDDKAGPNESDKYLYVDHFDLEFGPFIPQVAHENIAVDQGWLAHDFKWTEESRVVFFPREPE